MKTAAAILAALLASCAAPKWDGPNPLDSPTVTLDRPSAAGRFGPPHGIFEGF